MTEKITFIDTFDWRFYNCNLTLMRHGNNYRLAELSSENTVAEFAWKRKRAFRFWKDLADPHLQEKFRKIQDVRAAVPIVEVKTSVKYCEILNIDDKIVMRLRHENRSVLRKNQPAEKLTPVLKLLPVRGYHAEYREVCAALLVANLPPPEKSKPLLIKALTAVNIEPGKYSAKIKTGIEPQADARKAAVMLCRDMLAVMRSNEQGIIDDIDIEFLHDFRVTVRRTRALLAQLKGVFPRIETNKFKASFAAIGKATNQLRDCDVLLENRGRYLEMLPEELRDGLKNFFSNIIATRRKEYVNVTNFIRSEQYEAAIENWDSFLTKATTMPESKKSAIQAVELAGKLIIKRFRQVIKDGSSITDETPDAELHALRIDCKKLRYLMEFFTPLYPDKLNTPIARMKNLQTRLGDFNDYSVQILTLQAKISRFNPKAKDSMNTAAALGGLITVLAGEKDIQRHMFKASFAEFAGADNIAYFEDTFGKNKKSAK